MTHSREHGVDDGGVGVHSVSELEELRLAAEAVGSSQWKLSEVTAIGEAGLEHLVVGGDQQTFGLVATCIDRDDAAFIALANPQTVLALLDQIEALQGALIALNAAVDGYWNAGPRRSLNGPEAASICDAQLNARTALIHHQEAQP